MSDGIAATLRGLDDETRRGVVEALAQRSMSAGELAASLDVTPALLTRHLRVLRDAGIVAAALDPTDHRRHVYELRPEPLRQLRDWADEVAAFWTQQLAAFTKHATTPEARTPSKRRAGGARHAHR